MTAEVFRAHVRETPVERSVWLERETGARVWLKMECWQATGSFKIRGALTKLLSLDEKQRMRGVIGASSGNHGLALARAAAALRCPCLVFVPEGADPTKVERIRLEGAEVRVAGADCLEAELAARRLAAAQGRPYVSPYNDPEVVAGQATLGREILCQVPRVAAVFVALGGGGLAAGVGSAFADAGRAVDLVGCSPQRSPILHESLAAGRIVERPALPTLSDATAGGLEPGTITLALCRRFVRRTVLCSEAEIAAAMRGCMTHHHALVEGAAGVAVAGLLRSGARYAEQDVVVVLCGGNVSIETLREVLGAAARGSGGE